MSARLLVVDPVASSRIVMKAKLSAAYYDVEIARDAAQAAAKLDRFDPNLIIIGAGLPGAAIARFSEHLLSDQRRADIPVIAFTRPGEDGDTAICAALTAGADDAMPRPTNDVALFARLRAFLRVQSQSRDLTARLSQAGGAEAGQEVGQEHPGSVGIVTARPGRALIWQAGLLAGGLGRAEILDPRTVLGRAEGARPHDVFVIDGDLGRFGDGLSMLSDLRARALDRHAETLMLLPSGADDQAAAAFDLGASAVMHGPVTAEELALRIAPLLRRKSRGDRMRKALDASLAMAMHDPLTGLHNRRCAMGRLAELRAAGGHIAVILADIDHFKRINDRFGHATGDRALVDVANCLRRVMPQADITARIGGEEFLFAQRVDGLRAAADLAEQMRLAVSKLRVSCRDAQTCLPLAISVGAALDRSGQSLTATLERADAALYRAKRTGRNRVCMAEAQEA